jgi:hypothetical protein
MIDPQGTRLYSKMMCLIGVEENSISKEVEDAMKAFDKYMNVLNKTTGMLYSKNGEVLMEC